jgi:glutamine amidotransferase
MTIAVIDYGMGNLGAISNMLKKVGAEAMVTADGELIKSASKLIIPGVGAFDNGMKNLEERGLIPILNQLVLEDKVPVLGICLGMQLLTRKSEEGVLPGLGWMNAECRHFDRSRLQGSLKIPHMGWNFVHMNKDNPVFSGMFKNPRFYFVHSYHSICVDPEDILTTTIHGYEFVSSFARDNIIGTQFHPEKSHKFGMRLFKNFLECF